MSKQDVAVFHFSDNGEIITLTHWPWVMEIKLTIGLANHLYEWFIVFGDE